MTDVKSMIVFATVEHQPQKFHLGRKYLLFAVKSSKRPQLVEMYY